MKHLTGALIAIFLFSGVHLQANTVTIEQGGTKELSNSFTFSSTINDMSLNLDGDDKEYITASLKTWSQDGNGNVTTWVTVTVHEDAPLGEDLSINFDYSFTATNSIGIFSTPWTIRVFKEGYEISALFTANNREGSAPHTVEFRNFSSGLISAQEWDFGDGETSTEFEPLHTYSHPGIYSVTLTVSNEYHSVSSNIEDFITVLDYEPLTAAFSSCQTSGTSPYAVDFTDMTVEPAISWFWDFGDGSTSSEQNPSHIYQEKGRHLVSLVVSNGGYSDTVFSEINVVSLEWTHHVEIGNEPWNYLGTPAIDRFGRLYVTDKTMLFAIKEDGQPRWSFVPEGYGYSCSPPMVGNDGNIYAAPAGKMASYRPHGSLIWEKENLGGIDRIMSGADGDLILICNYNLNGVKEVHKMYALTDEQEIRWELSFEHQIFLEPAVGPDGTIYVGLSNVKDIDMTSHVVAVSPGGSILWEYETENYPESMAAGSDGTVFVSVPYSKFLALNPDGSLKWSFSEGQEGFFTPGYPVLDSVGNVYFRTDNDVYCINQEGELRWKTEFPEQNYITGDLVLGAENIYFGQGNFISALHMDGSLDWTYDVGNENEMRALAVGRNGLLYFREYEDRIYVIDAANRGIMNSSWPSRGAGGQRTYSVRPITTGIREAVDGRHETQDFDLITFPNPASSYFYVKLDADYTDAILTCTSITGQLMHCEAVDRTVNGQVTVNVEKWKSGIYLVSLTGTKGRTTAKIVVR